MEGLYLITLNTPFGVEKGELLLKINGEQLSGEIKAKNNITEITNGSIKGNNFSFSGKVKAGFMSVAFNAKGEILGEEISGVASTKYGDFEVKGEKIK
ncbi:MAG: hypothetical protein ACRC2K_06665 [Clostridium sp.]